MQLNNIPQPLRVYDKWCVWRRETRDGKQTKIPYCPDDIQRRAESDKPETFAPFAKAIAACKNGVFSGLGIGIFDDLAAVDIDNCIAENGELSPMARDIVKRMDSYTERSPSGRGIRIIFKAPRFEYDRDKYYINNRNNGLEVYIAGCTRRFVTITGDAIKQKPIAYRSKAISDVLDTYMLKPSKAKTIKLSPQAESFALTDNAVLEKAHKAKNGALFAKLWNGDVSGLQSPSEADLSLCNLLAFWCGRDEQQMDRLFRLSGLMREKWDRPQAGSTYGALTIQKAVADCKEFYNPTSVKIVTAKEDFAKQQSNEVQDIDGNWEPPIAFDSFEGGQFPLESLPRPVMEFVGALAESTQTPTEMAGLLSLGVLSTAARGRFDIVVNSDWKEPLCLYTVAVAPPGERKSAVISALTAPLREYEAERIEQERQAIAVNHARHEMLQKSLDDAKARCAKGKASPEEMEMAARELVEYEVIHPFRLLVDDCTPERLTNLLAQQRGVITISSAEGGLFDAFTGRYEKVLNLDVYLKSHAGDSISIDRMGRASDIIPRPQLTLILTVQPEALCGFMGNSTFRGRGLCGRFMYALCNSFVGARNVESLPVPDAIRARYHEFIKRILEDESRGAIRLSPEADQA